MVLLMMKPDRIFPAILCALLLLAAIPYAAYAETAATPAPDAPPSPVPVSDDLERMQLRLAELGYRLAPVSGVPDASHTASLSAFRTENGLSEDADGTAVSDALFGQQAKPAPFLQTAISLGRGLDDEPFAKGLALPWIDVKQRLAAGEIYPLTSCMSGIVFRMRYLDGDGHAELVPELSWDDATLYSLLSGSGAGRKMPVVVSIGGLRIAASIALNTAVPAQEDGLHRYCLHFLQSASDFNGIVDAEHQFLIQYATQPEADGAKSEPDSEASASPEPTAGPTDAVLGSGGGLDDNAQQDDSD